MAHEMTNSSMNWIDYWKNRWSKGDIGWHESEFHPLMIQFFKGLSPIRVFVPLCGKSKDMLWFLNQGHTVIGVEIAERACRDFFEENKIPFQHNSDGVFQGPGITIYNRSIFDVNVQLLGTIDAIYDRAALIALPPELRMEYSRHISHWVSRRAHPELQFCQITLERVPHDLNGPPFSVTEEELNQLYKKTFKITPLSREVEEKQGNQEILECSYRLSLL